MKDREKKMVVKHIQADDKEFRNQIAEDVKLKKSLMKKTNEKDAKPVSKARK